MWEKDDRTYLYISVKKDFYIEGICIEEKIAFQMKKIGLLKLTGQSIEIAIYINNDKIISIELKK